MPKINDKIFADFCKTTGYSVEQIGNIKLDILKKPADYERLRGIITNFITNDRNYSYFVDKLKYPFLQDKAAVSDLFQSFVEYYNEHGNGQLELTPNEMSEVCLQFSNFDVNDDPEEFGDPSKFGIAGNTAIFTVREIFDVMLFEYRCALVNLNANLSMYKTARPLVEYMFKLFGYGKSSLRGVEAQAVGIFLRRWNDIRESNPIDITIYDIRSLFKSAKIENSRLFQVYLGILDVHNTLIPAPNKIIQTMINLAFAEYVQKLVVKY